MVAPKVPSVAVPETRLNASSPRGSPAGEKISTRELARSSPARLSVTPRLKVTSWAAAEVSIDPGVIEKAVSSGVSSSPGPLWSKLTGKPAPTSSCEVQAFSLPALSESSRLAFHVPSGAYCGTVTVASNVPSYSVPATSSSGAEPRGVPSGAAIATSEASPSIPVIASVSSSVNVMFLGPPEVSTDPGKIVSSSSRGALVSQPPAKWFVPAPPSQESVPVPPSSMSSPSPPLRTSLAGSP